MTDVLNIELVTVTIYEYLNYKDGYHFSHAVNDLLKTTKYSNLSKDYKINEIKNNLKQVRNFTCNTTFKKLNLLDNLIRIRFNNSVGHKIETKVIIPDNVNEIIFNDPVYFNNITLPDSVTKIIFKYNINCEIPSTFFPPKLHKLYIESTSKGGKITSFPKTDILEFGSNFNMTLYEGIFSPFTRKIIFQYYAKQLPPNIFPNELETLILKGYDNKLYLLNNNEKKEKKNGSSDEELEESDDTDDEEYRKKSKKKTKGKNIYYDDNSDIKINTNKKDGKVNISHADAPTYTSLLPSKLKTLVLGDVYDTIFIVGCLPPSLISLTIGDEYNMSFKPYILPDSLKYLKLGNKYNKIFEKNVLPASLKTLILGNRYNLKFIELPNLETLILGKQYNKPFDNILPNTLKRLELKGKYSIEFQNQLPSLEVLVLEDYLHAFDKKILPNSLKSIDLGKHYNHIITENTFPDSLEILILSELYNKKLEYMSPNLKEIRFGKKYNQIIDNGILPPGLETIIFGEDYNQPILHNVIPSSVKKIVFGKHYNLKILPGVLSNELKHLEFCSEFKNMLLELPSSVKTLLIPKEHRIYVNELYSKENRIIKYLQHVSCTICEMENIANIYISDNDLLTYRCTDCFKWNNNGRNRGSKKKGKRDMDDD